MQTASARPKLKDGPRPEEVHTPRVRRGDDDQTHPQAERRLSGEDSDLDRPGAAEKNIPPFSTMISRTRHQSCPTLRPRRRPPRPWGQPRELSGRDHAAHQGRREFIRRHGVREWRKSGARGYTAQAGNDDGEWTGGPRPRDRGRAEVKIGLFDLDPERG